MKHVIAMMAVLLVASGMSRAATADIEIRQQQGVRYVTGGMTDDENRQMRQLPTWKKSPA